MINELTTKINSFDKHVRMDDTVIMVNIYAGGQVRVFFCSLTKRFLSTQTRLGILRGFNFTA